MTDRIPTRIPELTLRFAEASDAELLLRLIRELAEYEKLSHDVVADADTIRESLFGEGAVAEAVIAEYEGAAVGMAVFFHNFSTFIGRRGMYLEDLYVNPDFRGKGIGETLLAYLAKLAKARDCGRIEWSVLDWNESAIRFYKKLGAGAMDDWTVFRLGVDGIARLAERFDQGGS